MSKNIGSLYESENYSTSYRGILTREEGVKVFTEKNYMEVDSEVEFDIKKSHFSSLDYFSSSIIGGILLNLKKNFNRENILIDDLESKIELNLKNPLSLIGVRGYNEKPEISSCRITIYMYSELEGEKLIEFCKKSLDKCYIYNTICNAMEVTVKFIPTI